MPQPMAILWPLQDTGCARGGLSVTTRGGVGRGELAPPAPASLDRALLEIARVRTALVTAGDRATLERFDDADGGAAIAERLGYALLTGREARIVSQLASLSHATELVRQYLDACGVPRSSQIDASLLACPRVVAPPQAAPAGGARAGMR